MYKVEVKASPIRSGESVDLNVLTEARQGDLWTRKEGADFSIAGEDSRTFILEDNERVVISGKSNVAIVYDKEQNAAVPRNVDLEGERLKKEADEANRRRDQERPAANPTASSEGRIVSR